MDYVTGIKWLYENGVLAFIQALMVFAGLLFTGYQLRGARRSFQATVVSQISQRSADLQWEVIKDPELQTLLGVTSATAETKRGLAVGVILNHFAAIYDLWTLKGIPKRIWKTFEADLREWAAQPEFKKRWPDLREGHRRDFVRLVDRFVRDKAAQQESRVAHTTKQ